jgi:hypothetical protein
MRLACAALMAVVMAACSKSEATETHVANVVAQPVIVVTRSNIPLDTLIAHLDSARGFYWPKTPRQLQLTNAELHPERFRAHGRAAVQRLIDCLPDTTSTATYNGNDLSFKYPRGVLCYEILRQITDVDHSRYLRINRQDMYVNMAPGEVGMELKRAQRAWQVIHDSRAYRLRGFSAAE